MFLECYFSKSKICLKKIDTKYASNSEMEKWIAFNYNNIDGCNWACTRCAVEILEEYVKERLEKNYAI